MDEIKETLAILKTRWHEVSLLIGLWFLNRLVILTVRIYPEHMRLVQVVSVSLSIFILLVTIGFLRIVYLEPDERQSLADLLRTGKHFFWRFFILSAVAGLAMMFFFWLLRITGTLNVVSYRIISPFMKIIFAKLTLLLPAIIIVTDCSILKSFNLMWKIKLLQAQAKPLLIFFLVVNIVLPTLLMLLFSNIFRAHSSINWSDAIRTFYHVASNILALMVSVMAIRFVASLEIPDNNINL